MASLQKIVLATSILASSFIGASAQSIPQLVHAADIHFHLGTSVLSGSTPAGSFSYEPVASGTFNTTTAYNSQPLQAQVLPGGSGYAQIQSDGSFSVDVQVGAQQVSPSSGNGTFFRITTHEYIQPGLKLSGTYTTQYGALDAYQVIRVSTETSSPYNWLNAAALVGQESIGVVDGQVRDIMLRVFRVVVNGTSTS